MIIYLDSDKVSFLELRDNNVLEMIIDGVHVTWPPHQAKEALSAIELKVPKIPKEDKHA